MIKAFTGPTESDLTFDQRLWIVERMAKFRPTADVWRSGCASGVDSIAAFLAAACDLELELYVPEAWHNKTMVGQLKRSPLVKVVKCPGRPSKPLAYRVRNEMMVMGADMLHAFITDDTFYRSGEWMTINIAKKFNVPVRQEVIPNNL